MWHLQVFYGGHCVCQWLPLINSVGNDEHLHHAGCMGAHGPWPMGTHHKGNLTLRLTQENDPSQTM